MGLLIAPQLLTSVLEFTPVDERVASLHLRVGELVLTVIYAYAPITSSEYPPVLESLEKVQESAPTGDSIVLHEDFNAHVDSDSETFRGMTGRC